MSVFGLSGILANLGKVLTKITHGAEDSISVATQAVFDGSQRDCPVLTGFLKASGSIVPSKLGGSIVYTAPYAWYVENGTSRMSAQPFLYPNFVLGGAKWHYDLMAISPI